ncbi:unnamed protein product [Caenorhabditis angaria]|uniref:Uncharacterized protein n=1 Tax=Caenorhabditis angaria TaxID=860376 RepID=A0A9P1J1H7_9PELO|nr:unnamed protein product [Caenorhabditis angaria]
MYYVNLLFGIFSIIELGKSCELHCRQINEYLCAGEHLLTPSFINRVQGIADLLFSICRYDPDDGKTYKVMHDSSLKNSNFRPSFSITLTECNSQQIDFQKAIEQNHRKWMNSDCQIDSFLLLLVQNDTVYPHLTIRKHPTLQFEVERSYNLSLLDEITEISLIKMEEAIRTQPYNQNASEDFETLQDIKSHWPTWALVVVVVCIILSLLAFFLGNYITKRATPIRNKSQTQNAGKRERKWGAGFSGGLWAAA